MLKRILKVWLVLSLLILMVFTMGGPGNNQEVQAAEPTVINKTFVAEWDCTARRYLVPWWSDTVKELTFAEICSNYKGYGVAFRFIEVNIPKGAIIESAVLEFTASETQTLEPCYSDIRLENSYNPERMISYEDYIARPRTSYLNWWNIPPMYEGENYSTPNFATQLQEVVDTLGGTGDAVIVHVEDPTYWSQDGRFRKVASVRHDQYPPAMLHVTYIAEEEPPEPGIELEVRQITHVDGKIKIDIASTEYPYLPVYTLEVDWPATEQDIKVAILDAEGSIRSHIEEHKQIYDFFRDAGLLQFNTKDL